MAKLLVHKAVDARNGKRSCTIHECSKRYFFQFFPFVTVTNAQVNQAYISILSTRRRIGNVYPQKCPLCFTKRSKIQPAIAAFSLSKFRKQMALSYNMWQKSLLLHAKLSLGSRCKSHIFKWFVIFIFSPIQVWWKAQRIVLKVFTDCDQGRSTDELSHRTLCCKNVSCLVNSEVIYNCALRIVISQSVWLVWSIHGGSACTWIFCIFEDISKHEQCYMSEWWIWNLSGFWSILSLKLCFLFLALTQYILRYRYALRPNVWYQVSLLAFISKKS